MVPGRTRANRSMAREGRREQAAGNGLKHRLVVRTAVYIWIHTEPAFLRVLTDVRYRLFWGGFNNSFSLFLFFFFLFINLPHQFHRQKDNPELPKRRREW